MTLYPISEIFLSIQGEGVFVGRPTVFVRVHECNLRCPWCDTKYTWEGYSPTLMTFNEIKNEITEKYRFNDVDLCLTGGEPMCHPGLVEDFLHLRPHRFTMETNGTIPPTKGILEFSKGFPINSIVTLSPKLNVKNGWNKDSLMLWSSKFLVQYKVVVSSASEVIEAYDRITKVSYRNLVRPTPVIFQIESKVFTLRNGPLIETYKNILRTVMLMDTSENFDIRVLPQIHKVMEWR